MSIEKTWIRFYTIADFREEEMWLREQHKRGWKLTRLVPPCFYRFEKCDPEDVIYRLDYKNNAENDEYMQMMRDFGWEYCGKCIGWLYFRKSTADMENENDGELFSDNATRYSMLQHIMKTRLLPVAIIFLCCVIPNMTRTFDHMASAADVVLAVICLVIFIVYTWILIHCGIKLKKLKTELEE